MDIEKRYDVIIIGAGVLGAASAYHLMKNNPSKKILVIDRYFGPANGNTGRSNAMFRNTFTSEDNQLLSDCSIDFYLGVQKSSADIGMKQTGYLWLLSEKQLSLNARHISRMLDGEIAVKVLDKRALSEALPSLSFEPGSEESKIMRLENIEGGVFGAKCGRLDPVRITEYYLTMFEKLGGKVSFNTSAVRLLVEPSEILGVEGEPFVWQDARIVGVNVRGSISGEIRSDFVVIASGAWNNELLERVGIDGHVKAKKRQMFKIAAEADDKLMRLMQNDSFNTLHTLPFVILPTAGCFLKAISESREFWVACDDDFNREFINIPSHELDDYKAEPEYYLNNVNPILKEYFPEFKDKKPSNMWAGLYSYNTLDNIPYVFSEKGAIVVGGDSGSGIMKGDSLGRIVASVYSCSPESELYGGRYYPCDKLGFKRRSVEREEWVI